MHTNLRDAFLQNHKSMYHQKNSHKKWKLKKLSLTRKKVKQNKTRGKVFRDSDPSFATKKRRKTMSWLILARNIEILFLIQLI